MHELAVTESILDIALKHTPTGQRVRVIHLVIGQLSSIMDDSVQFYWDMVSENTAAAGAKLHFERIAAELQCRDCGERFGLSKADYACPACGSTQVKVVKGEEFYVESIEVEP
jgi:hydrogenase nickel incorporation protein HypA/HybF